MDHQCSTHWQPLRDKATVQRYWMVRNPLTSLAWHYPKQVVHRTLVERKTILLLHRPRRQGLYASTRLVAGTSHRYFRIQRDVLPSFRLKLQLNVNEPLSHGFHRCNEAAKQYKRQSLKRIEAFAMWADSAFVATIEAEHHCCSFIALFRKLSSRLCRPWK